MIGGPCSRCPAIGVHFFVRNLGPVLCEDLAHFAHGLATYPGINLLLDILDQCFVLEQC